MHVGDIYPGAHRRAPDPPRPRRQRLRQRQCRAQSDAIIGHHPHVPQGVEWYEGRPILHSLGNFVFLQTATRLEIARPADVPGLAFGIAVGLATLSVVTVGAYLIRARRERVLAPFGAR